MTLFEAVEILKNAGVDTPREDARRIFLDIGGLSYHELFSPEAASDSEAVAEAVARRAKREPLQYIIGKSGFYRESYRVGPGCLIPREDTEVLVDYAVKNLPSGARFADLCTGSGCIAISVLKNTSFTTAEAVDISEEALKIARLNAEDNGVSDRIKIYRHDVLGEPLSGSFFAVLSNPPYITAEEYSGLEPELFCEPRLALVGGGYDGADFYRIISRKYIDRIDDGGFIAFEIGYRQATVLSDIAREVGADIEIIKDYSGNDRVAVLRRRKN